MTAKLIAAALAAAAAFIFFCLKLAEGDYTENDRAYWFTVAVKRFVPFRKSAYDGKGNLSEAGTYYEFVLRDDFSGNIAILTDGVSLSSETELLVNGVPTDGAPSDPDYSLVFPDLILNKGDRLTFHSRFLFEENTDFRGFTIAKMQLQNEKGCFEVENLG